MAPRHTPRLAYLVLLCVSAALTPPEPPRRSLAGVWRLRRDVEGDVIDDVIVTLSAAGSSERGRLQSGTFAAIFHGEDGARAGGGGDAAAARAFAASMRGRWSLDA